ncbi:hypothetical protein ASPCAL14565 [Aspergillus calidoustus]|uniref:Aminoglycoside phosphotransferase domain-containing protein n=1 Tax=Aspergillus calidoustus TaxID=454130 RepID=A0A0U5GJC0_ASPCI|nr:hypothetical protein ASPCAL14565 [Aspergillus calidoustus]
MERVEGESLSSRWSSLTTDELKDVMTQIADLDLDGETQIPTMGDFVIGPVSARQFRHGEREKMESGRGPWLSPVDCVTSPTRREMAVIQHHAKAQPRQTFLLPTNYDIHPSEHSSLLSRFIQLAPYLIQPGSSSALAPTLRHPDLSLGNILLAPGSTRIASIIDWQDAVIYPRYMQAGYFAFCEQVSSRPQSLQIPSLPDHFNEMSVDKQSCFSPRRGQPLLHGRDRCKSMSNTWMF